MPNTLDDLSAALDSRYAIQRQLGAGGMATVYLARDLKHDRDVAIKVLRPDLARSIAAERFLREISISARLNHPHILALLDSGTGTEKGGDSDLLYYVMPVATGESLRDRLTARGALPVAEAVGLAADVAEALVYAHAQGVIHRDIKPDNILLSGGHAIVVDFGIAKALNVARDTGSLTSAGISLGTPAYMSPEQAGGDDAVDHRSDIYALGAVLFEMLAGAPPFSGTWTQIAMEKLSKPAPSLATRCPRLPPALIALVDRCLARDPAERPQTADDMLAALRSFNANGEVSARLGRFRRGAVAAGVVGIAVVSLLGALYARDRRHRWVRETAIPGVQRLIDADNLDSAFALLSLAAERAPKDSAVDAMWFDVGITQKFLSEPAGATVERASLNDTLHWVRIGVTPTPDVRIPKSAWFYRYTKPGYRPVTIMGAKLGGSYVPIPAPVPLRKLTDPDTDMVLLRGGSLVGTFFGLSSVGTFEMPDFLMDRLETTNRQYKKFVDAGGYGDPKWWDSPIVQHGKPIPFEAAMKLFVDKTGRPGPSTWEGSAAPDGADDLPLGGVSWYEARAFARFMGKELPTVIEWNAAAIPEAARWVVPNGRYESDSPVRGGAARAVGPRGVFDLAGNVREWTVNEREPGTRFILGGGWNDPPYLYSEVFSAPELDRSPTNGIRLIRRLGQNKDVARASAPIPRVVRSFDNVRPVDDATFKGFLALYDYDRTPLNAKVVARDTTPPDWVREDVEFDMPRGSAKRMSVAMFLPKHAKPPYQPVVIWPASDALILKDPHRLSMSYVDYIVRNGRAAIYPIYDHTYGRDASPPDNPPPNSIAHRDQVLRWTREMRRSIDYAVSRPDVDSTRIGFSGMSWGARMAGTVLGIEPRIRAAVLIVAGLSSADFRPEEDPVNFLPRIHIPVLMLSGKYDSTFPYEESQKPFLRLLGSAQKKQIVFEGGHFLPRPAMMGETLKWFDQYLGPVQR